MSISKSIQRSALLLVCFMVMLTAQAQQQEDFVLQLSPSKCVALRQGQTCYANVTLKWRSQKPQDLCIFQLEDATALQCWQNTNEGVFSGEISTKKAVEFQLREENTERVLASTVLKVAWVYKKKRRAVSWRIF